MRFGRTAATFLRRAWDQASHTSNPSPHLTSRHHESALAVGGRWARRSYSSRASGEEIGRQQKAVMRSSYFRRRGDSYRSILIAVAATGCLGGLYVVVSDSRVDRRDSEGLPPKKKVVLLGTGWAGMSFLKDINTDLYDVQVISPRNYFVFTPLIPSVTNGTVEARSIAEPIRRMCKNKKKEVRLFEAKCLEIDHNNKRLLCRDISDVTVKGKEEFIVDYDFLVVAVGALSNTFGVPGVEKYCHFLKELEDATRIRDTVVDCFETACLPHLTDDDRRKMLSFVIVGGGPTGVEFAAELHDLVHQDMAKLYPSVQEHVSVTVIEAVDHILNTFDARIQEYAESKFRRDGMFLKTNCQVKKVNEGEIVYFDKKANQEVALPFGLAVWSTGLGTRPLVKDFMVQVGQGDRKVLATDEWLRVKGCDATYAMGDCATVEQRKIMEDINLLFKLADADKSGKVTVDEFEELMELVRERYPQIDSFMKKKQLRDLKTLIKRAEATDQTDAVEVDLDRFKMAVEQIDAQMTRFPATAQVAAQQGSYLANCFNHLPFDSEAAQGPVRVRGEGHHRFKPFMYKHLGQFAPLGGEQAAAELPGDWISIGRSTQWLWYSVYASRQVSWRTRALVVYDWTKRLFFGRDSSRL
ncbi:NADH:quinone reductase (non-electrogenic) [Marchantia polymorpha subsp. ruderalis]|uniref:NADH:ubiquinone reductase (non-electrogenic) n=2 Tax=Marchantia polymorpha TaxID=3197 RepID=A0AAF6BTM4_MARPO|nr:hypothetical protein MARPO_0038s0104 [Marchantia polymorpha]BBN15358.1 hypothetical protein Mp_6g18940 [Marchantia polymorpha subsp. ruderalis]|eukprot:PTQ40791.1 hypothetical protein MARPO_0038s0104 [Marchantia polymorpha]